MGKTKAALLCGKWPESRVRLLSGKWEEGGGCVFCLMKRSCILQWPWSRIWTRNIGDSAQPDLVSTHPDRAVPEMSPSALHLGQVVET